MTLTRKGVDGIITSSDFTHRDEEHLLGIGFVHHTCRYLCARQIGPFKGVSYAAVRSTHAQVFGSRQCIPLLASTI
jgi:hypothetical protein